MPQVPPHLPGGRASGWLSGAVLGWMRQRIADSGGDPTAIHDEPSALWRVSTVEARTGLSRATIYRLAAAGEFPKPIRLAMRPTERAA